MTPNRIIYVHGVFSGEVTLGPPTGRYGAGDGDLVARGVTLIRQADAWRVTVREEVDGVPDDALPAATQRVDDPTVVAFLDTLGGMLADPRGFGERQP